VGVLLEEESCLAFFGENVFEAFVTFDGFCEFIFGVMIVLGFDRTTVEVTEGVREWMVELPDVIEVDLEKL